MSEEGHQARSNQITDFQREQLKLDLYKARLTAGSIIISAAAALVTYISAQVVQSIQANDAFQLKVAELMMTSRNAFEAQGKAKALALFFPDRVPEKWATQVNPDDANWGRASHEDLLRYLLTTNPTSPEHRAMVLKTYKTIFPNEPWVDKIGQIP